MNRLEGASKTFVLGWLIYRDADGQQTVAGDEVATVLVNDAEIERENGEEFEKFDARVRRIATDELGVSVCVPWIPGDEKV